MAPNDVYNLPQYTKNLSNKYQNLSIVNNPKNIGASMNIGIKKALESDFNYLVKIDGDNQFRNIMLRTCLKLQIIVDLTL